VTAARTDPAPLLAAGVTLLLAAAVPAGAVPDGPELAAAGSCLFRGALDAAACGGTEPFFWMPAFPLLSGLFTLFTDPWAAAHAAAAVVVGLLVVPLSSLGRRLGVAAPSWVAAALLVATPAVRELVAQPSGRGLAWLGILGGASVVAGARGCAAPLRRGVAVGALLALAILSRREAVLQAVMVGLALVPLAPRAAVAAGATVTGLTAPWFVMLAAAAGGVRTSGRAWEPLVYAWDTVVPHEWLLMEISMGTWGTPLRSLVSRLPAGVSTTVLDPGVLVPWLQYALPVAVPAWLAALALAGAGLLVRSRAGRWSLGAAVALAVPALPLALLPNARDVDLPSQNLHPVCLAAILIGAVAAGEVLRWARERLPAGQVTAPALAITLLAGLSMANARWVAQVVPSEGRSPTTLTGAGAALAQDPGPVWTTLSSAPAARRADRPRAALPSPYRVGEASPGPAQRVLLTELDLPGARRTLGALAGSLRPTTVLQDGDRWAVVFYVEASPVSQAPVEQPRP